MDAASTLSITQLGYDRLPTSSSTAVNTLGYSHFLYGLKQSERRPALPLYLFLNLLQCMQRSTECLVCIIRSYLA
jgi:hypothetical protein